MNQSISLMPISRWRCPNINKNENLKDKTVYDSYINQDAVDYAMVFTDRDDKSTIIFDSKNSAMLILSDSDGEKTGFAMGIDPEMLAKEVEEYAEESEADPYKAYKTGKTKTILGYSCDEYLVEDEKSEAHMWVIRKTAGTGPPGIVEQPADLWCSLLSCGVPEWNGSGI